MKHQIKDGDRLIATIETHGDAVVVVHEPKREIKPVQFATDRETYVECTPEQRSEIIRIAREYGRELYGPTEKGVDSDVYTNLFWDYNNNHVCGTLATPEDYQSLNWVPFDEFVARLKGKWIELRPEPANPDYSHLIGKWVRYIKDRNMKDYNVGSWYPVKGIDSDGDVIISSLPNDSDNTGWSSPEINFDLSNPRDTNPDEPKEVRIPFSIERYDSGDFIRYETRDGRVPEHVYVRLGRNVDYPVVMILSDTIYSLSIEGNYATDETERPQDLLMVIMSKEGDK